MTLVSPASTRRQFQERHSTSVQTRAGLCLDLLTVVYPTLGAGGRVELGGHSRCMMTVTTMAMSKVRTAGMRVVAAVIPLSERALTRQLSVQHPEHLLRGVLSRASVPATTVVQGQWTVQLVTRALEELERQRLATLHRRQISAQAGVRTAGAVWWPRTRGRCFGRTRRPSSSMHFEVDERVAKPLSSRMNTENLHLITISRMFGRESRQRRTTTQCVALMLTVSAKRVRGATRGHAR